MRDLLVELVSPALLFGAEQTWTEWASSMNPLASAPAPVAPAPVYLPGVYLDPTSPQVGLVADAFRAAIQVAQASGDTVKAQRLFATQVTWWNRSRALGLTDPGAIVASALFVADMIKVRGDLEPQIARLAPAAAAKGTEIVEKSYLDYAADFARGTADTIQHLQDRALTTADKALNLPKEVGEEGGENLIKIAKIGGVAVVGAVGLAVLGGVLRDALSTRRDVVKEPS